MHNPVGDITLTTYTTTTNTTYDKAIENAHKFEASAKERQGSIKKAAQTGPGRRQKTGGRRQELVCHSLWVDFGLGRNKKKSK